MSLSGRSWNRQNQEYQDAPLGEIIASSNLFCIELTGLTHSAALQHLVAQGGPLEAPADEDREPLAGFIYVSAHYDCIFVECHDLLAHRRFSIAHKLGHYFLHFRPVLQEAERQHRHVEGLACSRQPTQPSLRTACANIPGRVAVSMLLIPATRTGDSGVPSPVPAAAIWRDKGNGGQGLALKRLFRGLDELLPGRQKAAQPVAPPRNHSWLAGRR